MPPRTRQSCALEPLHALGPDLLGDILSRLPRESLGSARLAARVFDAAARELVTALTFSPDTVSGLRRDAPRLQRFPALSCLRLEGWCMGEEACYSFFTPRCRKESEKFITLLSRLSAGAGGHASAARAAAEAAATAAAGAASSRGGARGRAGARAAVKAAAAAAARAASSRSGAIAASSAAAPRPANEAAAAAAADAALARVTSLDTLRCSLEDKDASAAVTALIMELPVLRRFLCSAYCLKVDQWEDQRALRTPPILEALPPTLEALCAPRLNMGAREARALARLPSLSALFVAAFRGDSDQLTDKAAAAAEAAALAALPLSRLTSLGLMLLPRAPLQSLGLTALREPTGGVELPCERLRELAAGLPQLRLLNARPIGEWGPTDAIFARVEVAALENYCDTSFAARVRLAQLFPALVRLELDPWPADTSARISAVDEAVEIGFRGVKLPDLAGLTGLSSLCVSVDADTAPPPPLRREHIAAIASMADLRELQCAVRPWRITALTALSALTGLTSLDLAIADCEMEVQSDYPSESEDEDDPMFHPPDVDEEDGEDALTRRRTLLDVFQAAAHLPALRVLGLCWANAPDDDTFGVCEWPEDRVDWPAPPLFGPDAALRTLVIYATEVNGDLAEALAPFAGAPLTRAVLDCSREERADARRWARELAPLGLELVRRDTIHAAQAALGFPQWRFGTWPECNRLYKHYE